MGFLPNYVITNMTWGTWGISFDEISVSLDCCIKDYGTQQTRIMSLNIHCDLSLEPSHRDGSNERSQYMFSLMFEKNYLRIIPVTPYLDPTKCPNLLLRN